MQQIEQQKTSAFVPLTLKRWIGSDRSTAKVIKIGVPQGSVLGPLLFNIFINDLFLINLDSEICNFADDNTLYSCGHDLQEIVTNLENDLSELLEWFKSNGMLLTLKNSS